MNETSDAAELLTQWRDHLRDVLQSFMCIDSEPKCIRDLPAVIQHSSSFECSDKRRTVIGQLGNVFPDRIVDTEVSILLQQYERCGRELLRD